MKNKKITLCFSVLAFSFVMVNASTQQNSTNQTLDKKEKTAKVNDANKGISKSVVKKQKTATITDEQKVINEKKAMLITNGVSKSK